MRHALLGLILVGALSGAGGLAHAQGKGRSRSEREAQALYQKGLKAYNLADYDKAIEAFKAAYELSEAPRLLYNIAQAYRLKGDCPQALRFYKTFLREQPTASNRSSVEGLVAEMEKCAQAPAPKPPLTPAPTVEPKPEPVPMPVTPAPPPPSAPAPAVAPSAPAPIESPPAARPPMEPPHESDRGHTTRVVGLVTAGVGVALMGTAVYFGAQASSDADEVTRLFQMHGTWTPHYQQVESDGQTADLIQKVLYGVGGAAVVGGAILYYLGVRAESAPDAQVSFSPLPGGGAMVWSCRF
ncbi:MAG TPA: hypothetical protein VKN99_26475 [Polyangia bacterium]|nr:hypothetical protein [Polyangia bacterium]